MRTLHADLEAAQKQIRGIRPYITVTVKDRHAGAVRTHPDLVYDGSETESQHGITVTTANGVILRPRLEAGVIVINRVTDP